MRSKRMPPSPEHRHRVRLQSAGKEAAVGDDVKKWCGDTLDGRSGVKTAPRAGRVRRLGAGAAFHETLQEIGVRY